MTTEKALVLLAVAAVAIALMAWVKYSTMSRPRGPKTQGFLDSELWKSRLRRWSRRHAEDRGKTAHALNLDAAAALQDQLVAKARRLVALVGINPLRRLPRMEAALESDLLCFDHRSAELQTKRGQVEKTHQRMDEALEGVGTGRALHTGLFLVLIGSAWAVEAPLIGTAFSVLLTDGFAVLRWAAGGAMALVIVYLGHHAGRYLGKGGDVGGWPKSALVLLAIIHLALTPLRVVATSMINAATETNGWAAASPDTSAIQATDWMLTLGLGALAVAFSVAAGFASKDHHSKGHKAVGFARGQALKAGLAYRRAQRRQRLAKARATRSVVALRSLWVTVMLWAEMARQQMNEDLSSHLEGIAYRTGHLGAARRVGAGDLEIGATDWEIRARSRIVELDLLRRALSSTGLLANLRAPGGNGHRNRIEVGETVLVTPQPGDGA